MTILTDRRSAIQSVGLGIVAFGAVGLATMTAQNARAADLAPLTVPGASHLRELMDRLGRAPRRRDFKTVPMILSSEDQWDHEALNELKAYKPAPKQVWDNTDLAGPWLNLMRNSLNAQIWSFKHPDFLAISATHGLAHLALLDQAMWDKYQLAKIAGDKFPRNILIEETAAADPLNYEDPAGAFSSKANSIPALMRRGVVFLACHNAIWELAGKFHADAPGSDKPPQEEIAAELTNHLIPGIVLTPGIVATLPELQQAGFYYAK
jgi:hypothetical protein